MPATALLFPGQGAQVVGMGVAPASTLPAARDLFERAGEVLGYDLLKLCQDGPAGRLNATDVSQPALYVASLAALEQLKVTNPALVDEVTCCAGLSLGEYTALTFAGALTFEEGLGVVRERGRAMQAAAEATPSGMLSLIGPSVLEVEALLAECQNAGLVRVANLLCPGNTVVSGEQSAIDTVAALCETKGVRSVKLAVAGAFHTSLMRPADEALFAALDGVALHPLPRAGVLERGRRAARRAGRDSAAIDPAGARAGALGGVDAGDARGGRDAVRGSRAGAGAGGAFEADRPEVGHRERAGVRGFVPGSARGIFPGPEAGLRIETPTAFGSGLCPASGPGKMPRAEPGTKPETPPVPGVPPFLFARRV